MGLLIVKVSSNQEFIYVALFAFFSLYLTHLISNEKFFSKTFPAVLDTRVEKVPSLWEKTENTDKQTKITCNFTTQRWSLLM